MRAVVIAILVVVASGRLASAQIVNVQGALAKPPAEDGMTGEVALKVNWREGNNPILDLGAAASTVLRHGRWLGLAIVRGGYGKSREVLLSRKTFEHLRARVRLDDTWRWELFAQHEYDQFRRLRFRALTGTGPAYQIVDSPAFGLLAGAAYMLELEELDDRMGATDAGDRTLAHRVSAYITGHQVANANVDIVETVYAQPRIDEPSDFRLLGELAVQSKLASRFSLRTAFTFAFDTSPPDLLVRYDTALEVALVVKL